MSFAFLYITPKRVVIKGMDSIDCSVPGCIMAVVLVDPGCWSRSENAYVTASFRSADHGAKTCGEPAMMPSAALCNALSKLARLEVGVAAALCSASAKLMSAPYRVRAWIARGGSPMTSFGRPNSQRTPPGSLPG